MSLGIFLILSCGPIEVPKISCTVSKTGTISTIICPDGSTVNIIDGSKGDTGNTGEVGPQGIQGVQGTPGTSVSVVLFCSNKTTSYPSSFPEYGLCINNRLYGVFWDNKNSWLAEIPPGTYRSTSTSAACDFQVKPNCIIQGI